jgi:hypothetical protein
VLLRGLDPAPKDSFLGTSRTTGSKPPSCRKEAVLLRRRGGSWNSRGGSWGAGG